MGYPAWFVTVPFAAYICVVGQLYNRQKSVRKKGAAMPSPSRMDTCPAFGDNSTEKDLPASPYMRRFSHWTDTLAVVFPNDYTGVWDTRGGATRASEMRCRVTSVRCKRNLKNWPTRTDRPCSCAHFACGRRPGQDPPPPLARTARAAMASPAQNTVGRYPRVRCPGQIALRSNSSLARKSHATRRRHGWRGAGAGAFPPGRFVPLPRKTVGALVDSSAACCRCWSHQFSKTSSGTTETACHTMLCHRLTPNSVNVPLANRLPAGVMPTSRAPAFRSTVRRSLD